MKRPFTIYDLRFTIWKKSAAPVAANHQSSIINHKSQRGVALIITLILLAVVTIMAITFLGISRRERNSVTTVTDTATARLAADAALANAEAQIIANAVVTTNPYGFGLLVSTNYINPIGFQSGISSYTNVNYQYPGGNNVYSNLAGSDFLLLLTNLWYSPRPPVFVDTNPGTPLDFRFYVDLNRNRRFDPSGLVTNYDAAGNPLFYGGLIVTNVEVGDPQWIGVLERPDAPHGPNNRFIARYAFVAVPAGNTLDLNAIHNEVFEAGNSDPTVNPAANQPGNAGLDYFFRNQGVGSWEINLAAFLADLNTNQWGLVIGNPINYNFYFYQYLPGQNRGVAFDDARALLAWRYYNNYSSLAFVKNGVNGLFPFVAGAAAFRNNIDYYSDGPLMYTVSGTNDYFQDLTFSWAGADNTNQFFTHQELFDFTKTTLGVAQPQINAGNDFSDRLLAAGQTNSTYDRYTFYRLLAQLGSDTAPEPGKMNLNYSNILVGYNDQGSMTTNAIVPGAETNFVSWRPLDFFNATADRLLRAYTTQWRNSNPTNFAMAIYGAPANIFSVTNYTFTADQWTNYPAFGIDRIPVLISNQFVYAPAVNRLLQLAANIYDATTNQTWALGLNYPSVFRPLFSRDANASGVAGYGTNVFITGFTDVPLVNPNDTVLDIFQPLSAPLEATDLSVTNVSLVGGVTTTIGGVTNWAVNIFGVPWIVGAKKGFPNFNELAMDNSFMLTRKLQVTRPDPSAPKESYSYNQMFLMSFTSQLGVECWNSYTNNFTNGVLMIATEFLRNLILTNDIGFATNWSFTTAGSLNLSAWPGYDPVGNPMGANASFQLPLNTVIAAIPNSMYRFNGGFPYLTTNLDLPYETNLPTTMPGYPYPTPHWWLMLTNDLRVMMLMPWPTATSPSNRVIDYVQLRGPSSFRDLTAELQNTVNSNLWLINYTTQSIPNGLANQVSISLGLIQPPLNDWNTKDPTVRSNEINAFRVFFHVSPLPPSQTADYGWATSTNNMQAPYTPSATNVQHFSWQANDPLVHYVGADLNWASASRLDHIAAALTSENLGHLNQRYMPWGGNPADQNSTYLGIKDPLVRRSDDWDFPTNKFPTVGWLGRVHRGTPWQTVYLKASDITSLVQTNVTTTNYLGLATWANWLGSAKYNSINLAAANATASPWANLTGNDLFNALCSAPVQDRLLFDLFTIAPNDNAARGALSVNVGPTNNNLAAWSALFSGVVVLSNNAPDAAINPPILFAQHANSLVNYTWLYVQPVGFYDRLLPLSLQPAVAQIVQGINATRSDTNQFPLQSFTHTGDILAVPQLTEQSPFLNRSTGIQLTNGISDELYEWLPQQVLSLLHCAPSPRYVIYCYGQALKPAPRGIYTGTTPAGMFGLVTNYQVVAEAATRAVVRFDSVITNHLTAVSNSILVGTTLYAVTNWVNLPAVTNNNAVIERFNVLPPD